MPTFSTDFTPPPPLTGFTILGNVELSRVELEWDATALVADFGGYRVSRSSDGGLTWIELELIMTETVTTYNDYTAPLDTLLQYRVTVSNLDFESEPVSGSVTLAGGGWWLVRPGDADLTFAITYVDGHRKRKTKAQTVYRPAGRSRPIVTSGLQQGWEGSINATVPPALRDVIDRVVSLAGGFDEWVYLKSPFGEVFPVQLGDVEVNRGLGGTQLLTFPFVEVA